MTHGKNDVLLLASDVTKIYPNPAHRLRILWHALMRPSKPYTNGHCVLENVNFSVHRGETLGLIGRNGAGKSTLLAMLAQLVSPTFGKIEARGSVAVLLGSGIAFNGDLSGRDNARAYCRLNGIPQRALDARLAEIERFSDLGDYFDIPVGAYSSGMQARLSFACAIARHADVLIVDEVLAVGDAEFRAKCYNYIRERQSAGQTYVLVSHSPSIIASFCTRVCLLDRGKVLYIGEPREALERYKLLQIETRQLKYNTALSVVNSAEASIEPQAIDIRPEEIEFKFSVSANSIGNRYILRCQIKNDKGIGLENYQMPFEQSFVLQRHQRKNFSFRFDNRLRPGRYWIQIALVQFDEEDDAQVVCIAPTAFKLDIVGEHVGGMVNLMFRPTASTEEDFVPALEQRTSN